MLEGKRVAVVVPAHNEETLIGETLASIPYFVDRIYVVDDHSSDGTAAAVRDLDYARVELIEHERNEGVGAAILTGYRRALDERVEVADHVLLAHPPEEALEEEPGDARDDPAEADPGALADAVDRA